MQMSLRALRVNANLTQQKAADELGIYLKTLQNYESGKTFPSQPVIERMCALYGVSYDQIRFLP